MADLIKAVEGKTNSQIPALHPGDSVSVHVRIKEGDKERVQEFKGTVIRMGRAGNNANFTVRRTASHGIGVERTFLLRSPRIEKVEVTRHASVRRSKLYYLRNLSGKQARLREKREA
jgi:large subunit ribosomal protein L19